VLYVGSILYVLAQLSVKILLLSIMIRIFGRACPKVRLFMRIFTAFLAVYYVATLFLRIFVCIPPSAVWKGGGRCLDFFPALAVDFHVSLITDGIILSLAIFLAATLHLPFKKRIRIGALLGAGGLTIPSNIYRLYKFWTVGDNPDWSYHVADWQYLQETEISIGLICACLPAISGLITYNLRRPSSTCDMLQARIPNIGAAERTSSSICMATDEATSTNQDY
ncbi:hypothetical protein N7486_004124, partial [Penicillium sp. IBT 16267x]